MLSRNLTNWINSPQNNGTAWTLDTISVTAMLIVLSVMGILGNTPTLIVFLKWKDRHSSNTFIKILAVIDLLVCMFVMPFTIFYELHTVTSDVACRLLEYLSHFTVFASNATLVAIAIERYIAVCKIGLRLNTELICKGAVIIIIVSAFVAIPATGIFAVGNNDTLSDLSCIFPHESAPENICHFTYAIMGEEAVTIYQIFQLVMFIIILIVIIMLYSSVYVVLWKRTKFRKQIRDRRAGIQSFIDPVDEDDCQFTEIRRVSNKLEDIRNLDIALQNIKHLGMKPNSLPNLYLGLYQNISQRRTRSVPNNLWNTFIFRHQTLQRQTSVSAASIPAEEPERRVRLPVLTVLSSRTKTQRPKCEVVMQRTDTAKSRRFYYHIRTAKMLFLCTVIYFVTWIPFWLDIFGMTNSRTFRHLFFIGHATNPIIYGVVNKHVREACKALLLSCIRCKCIHGHRY